MYPKKKPLVINLFFPGNDDIHYNEIDLDGDFDPAEHDRKMQEIFNDDFYVGPEGDQKPEFPDIDQELEVETTWDKYDPKEEPTPPETEYNDGPHCDDPDFNVILIIDRETCENFNSSNLG